MGRGLTEQQFAAVRENVEYQLRFGSAAWPHLGRVEEQMMWHIDWHTHKEICKFNQDRKHIDDVNEAQSIQSVLNGLNSRGRNQSGRVRTFQREET